MIFCGELRKCELFVDEMDVNQIDWGKKGKDDSINVFVQLLHV